LAAAILKAVQDKKITLDQKVFFTQKDIFNPAPATRPALKQGFMTVEELCLATVSKSDNPAANLLTHLIGGLSGLKAFTTLLGDETMRFDRLEPHLNDVGMSDMRDTVTPKAMTTLLFSALEGPVLADRSKLYLKDWMRATTTGFERIRAAVPKGIDIGDKTGTSGDGLAHDVAFLYPKDGSPIYLSVFTRTQSEETSINNSAIRAVTALVMSRLKLGVL
jgi:beta-lactamase class A